MHERDQELLAKQLWAVSSPPQNSALVGLTILAVFFTRHRYRRYSLQIKASQYRLRSYGFQNSGSTAMIRVFVETPKGRGSAGFTVPESAAADDVLKTLRSRGWSPFALRLDLEQHAWIALVLDWRRAA